MHYFSRRHRQDLEHRVRRGRVKPIKSLNGHNGALQGELIAFSTHISEYTCADLVHRTLLNTLAQAADRLKSPA